MKWKAEKSDRIPGKEEKMLIMKAVERIEQIQELIIERMKEEKEIFTIMILYNRFKPFQKEKNTHEETIVEYNE